MTNKKAAKKAVEKKHKSRVKKKTSNDDFDKYYYYHTSVQSPENDVIFIRKTYNELRGKEPKTLREDFCGTFSISCEWVKLNPTFEAFGVDFDPEPIQYGKDHYFKELSAPQQKRINISEGNVLDKGHEKVDFLSAQNFSYYIFKTRDELRAYFKNACDGIHKDGVFMVDCFGGSQCMEPNEEETEHDGNWSYFWDQDSYDPVSNFAQFYIHFKRKGEKKREKVFSYDWRMWTIPEIREIMIEAGFKKTHVYWEGTTSDGEGDGVFHRVNEGEDCEAWVAYVAAEK